MRREDVRRAGASLRQDSEVTPVHLSHTIVAPAGLTSRRAMVDDTGEAGYDGVNGSRR